MQMTIGMLKNKIAYLNKITNSPGEAWTRDANGFKANIGNFHLYQAYGAFGLHRNVNEGGGISDSYVYGLHTKRELASRIDALIRGYELAGE